MSAEKREILGGAPYGLVDVKVVGVDKIVYVAFTKQINVVGVIVVDREKMLAMVVSAVKDTSNVVLNRDFVPIQFSHDMQFGDALDAAKALISHRSRVPMDNFDIIGQGYDTSGREEYPNKPEASADDIKRYSDTSKWIIENSLPVRIKAILDTRALMPTPST